MRRTAPRAAALQVSFSRCSKALGFVDRPSLFAIFGETPVPITEVEANTDWDFQVEPPLPP